MLSKRIFIGGLSESVSVDELTQRFSHFGRVSNVSLKTRVDDKGVALKSFAHLDLQGDEASLKRCFSTYQNAKWKGSVLKLQYAKESVLERLQKERQEDISSEVANVKPQKEARPIAEIVATAKGVPGTPVEGKKDWVVGKYGRTVPILKLKKSYKIPMVKHDPSKYCHAAKIFKEEVPGSSPEKSCNKLTWEIDEPDSVMTKKRKGEFPHNIVPPKKKPALNVDGAKIHHEQKPPKVKSLSLNGVVSGQKYDIEDLEIVKIGLPVRNPIVPNASSVSNRFDSDDEIESESTSLGKKPNNHSNFKANNSRQSETATNMSKDKHSNSENGFKKSSLVPEFRGLSMLLDFNETPKFSKTLRSSVDELCLRNSNSKGNDNLQLENCEVKRLPASGQGSRSPVSKTTPIKNLTASNGRQNTSENTNQVQQVKKLIPEFKGLGMIEDLKVQKQSQISPTASDSNATQTGPALPKKKVLSSSAQPEKSGKNTGYEQVSTLSAKSNKEAESGSHSDSSAGTDEIICKHKSRLKVTTTSAHRSSLTSKQEVRLAESTPMKVSTMADNLYVSEFDSGITKDDETSHNDQHSFGENAIDSYDSDLDSNDFALVAKKLQQQALNKGKSRSSKLPLQTEADIAYKQSQSEVQSQNIDATGAREKQTTVLSKEERKELKGGRLSEQSRHKTANERRLEAMREQAKHRQQQQQVMQQALKHVDSPLEANTKRIVFETSDEESEGEPKSKDVSSAVATSSVLGTGVHNAMDEKAQGGSRLSLFAGSSDEEEDNTDYNKMFMSKPQFEGKKGEKLLKMERRFGDSRFKLDAKFADSDSGEEDSGVENETRDLTSDLKEEQSVSLKVLENIVGKTTLDRFSEKINRNTKKIIDMNAVRFDPTKISHRPVEATAEPAVKKKKQVEMKFSALDLNQAKAAQTKSQEDIADNDQQSAGSPFSKGASVEQEDRVKNKKEQGSAKQAEHASKSSRAEVSGSLVDLFRGPAQPGSKDSSNNDMSFSLLQQFGAVDSDEEDQGDRREAGVQLNFERNKATSVKAGAVTKSQTIEESKDGSQEGLSKTTHQPYLEESELSSEEDEGNEKEMEIDSSNMTTAAQTGEGIDAEMIRAGKVDVRFTKEEWHEQWDTLRQSIIKIYKRKHKDALKKKRMHVETKRKKEYLKNSRKFGKKNWGTVRKR